MLENIDLLTLFLKHPSVCTDSRKLNKGDIFFALKGQNFNGNQFALQAIENGASYAVIDEKVTIDQNAEEQNKLIFVSNTLTSLQKLANDYRNYLNIPVIGLTGSNGKTTTKELIAEVLNCQFKINFTKGNLNNEIGVPLTILNTKADDEMLVVEMGANHQGEIALLSEIANPNFGIITNIGKAHLEGFGGEEGVKKGKSELFRHLAKHGGIIFANHEDDVILSVLPSGMNVISYYPSQFKILAHSPYLILSKDSKSIETKFVGDYNINNIAAAFTVGRYFGIDEDIISSAIEKYQPNNNRSQLDIVKGVQIVKDAYNANPSSIKASLQSFLKDDVKNKAIILGDMLELGEYSEVEHRSVINYLQSFDLFDCIFIGKEFYKNKNNQSQFFETTQDAKKSFQIEKYEGKTLLIKGSRGIALEKLLEA